MENIASHKTRSAFRTLTRFAAAATAACTLFFAASGVAQARAHHHRHSQVATTKHFKNAAGLIGYRESGQASFYKNPRQPGVMGAAHKWLPKGTHVKVTNLANAHQVCLTINDRGPFVAGRIIDVAKPAVGPLGMLDAGHVPVTIEVVASCGAARTQQLAHLDLGS